MNLRPVPCRGKDDGREVHPAFPMREREKRSKRGKMKLPVGFPSPSLLLSFSLLLLSFSPSLLLLSFSPFKDAEGQE